MEVILAKTAGFCLDVYKRQSQSGDGRAVSTSNLRAGDLVFYGDGGSIDHVALYIGGGQVVHASNSAPSPRGGIKISNVNYRTPICARRIIG